MKCFYSSGLSIMIHFIRQSLFTFYDSKAHPGPIIDGNFNFFFPEKTQLLIVNDIYIYIHVYIVYILSLTKRNLKNYSGGGKLVAQFSGRPQSHAKTGRKLPPLNLKTIHFTGYLFTSIFFPCLLVVFLFFLVGKEKNKAHSFVERKTYSRKPGGGRGWGRRREGVVLLSVTICGDPHDGRMLVHVLATRHFIPTLSLDMESIYLRYQADLFQYQTFMSIFICKEVWSQD